MYMYMYIGYIQVRDNMSWSDLVFLFLSHKLKKEYQVIQEERCAYSAK